MDCCWVLLHEQVHSQRCVDEAEPGAASTHEEMLLVSRLFQNSVFPGTWRPAAAASDKEVTEAITPEAQSEVGHQGRAAQVRQSGGRASA